MNQKILLTLFATILLCSPTINARKISAKAPHPPKSSAESLSNKLLNVQDFEDHGMACEQFIFTGYDKPASSANESFFITNNSTVQVSQITVEICYMDIEGREFHRRKAIADVDLPAGSTRNVTIPSWDKQKSYHYYHSVRSPKRITNPYRVAIALLSACVSIQ